MGNIYQLPKDIEEALNKYYECFDEDTGELIIEEVEFKKIEKELFELQNKKEDLIEWYLKSRQNKKAENEGLQGEIKRLQDRIARNNKRVDKIENIVDFQFRDDYKKPIHLGSFTVSYRKSKQTIIEDENLIDNKYKKYSEICKIDKKELKKDIEAGAKVEGAKIVENLNLTIK